MKQYIYFIIFGTFFLLMILFPADSFQGALSGLNLWFQTVVPTILPFAIISNFLIQSNCVSYITHFLSPLFCKFFHITPAGCYAVFVGFLCGYPLGAKTIADLVKQNKISLLEGQYLLSFCNNTSPVFIINYLVHQNLNDKNLLFPTIFILYLSPIFCSFLFRVHHKKDNIELSKESKPEKINFDFSVFDYSIMNGFESIFKIGGYIILFSILLSFSKHLPFYSLFAFLEITNGIPLLRNSYPLCLALTSYGGLCSFFQTNSMIQGSGLSIKKYHKEKLITAMVTSSFTYIYILFITP